MEVDGDPHTIIARGGKIRELGRMMRQSAEVLESIKTSACDQQGQAIEELRESIGDSHATLAQAAELYEPVGPVICAYGQELSDLQPLINKRAEGCRELWTTYRSLPGSVEPRGVGGWFEPDEGSDEAEQQAEEDEAKKEAHDAWKEEAKYFDNDCDTWEQAFDDAVSGISEEMSDTIEDGAWRSFLDGLSTALGWAGLIVGVAALIIGGPILAAMALVIGALSLAVVIAQAVQGDKNGWDIGIAALGVLPVGKLGKFGKIFQGRGKDWAKNDVFSSFTDLKKLKTSPREMDGLASVFKNNGASEGFKKLLTGSTTQENVSALKGWASGGDVGRVSWQSLGKFEVGANFVGNALKFEGWASQATPWPGISSVAPRTNDVLGVAF